MLIHGPAWEMDPDNFVSNEVEVGFVIRTLSTLDQ
jgi:hypothetical protein